MKSKFAFSTLAALLMSAVLAIASDQPGTEVKKVWFNHEWTNFTKNTQEFDTDGSGKCLVTIQHNFKYSFAASDYVEQSRTLLFYDSHQQLVRKLNQIYSNTSRTFIDDTEEKFTYTREGLLQSATMRKVEHPLVGLVGTDAQVNDSRTIGSNDKWENVSFKTYTYTSLGLLNNYILELWNPFTKDYEPSQQEFYYYDRNNQLLTTLRQAWKFDSRRWTNDSKQINTYMGKLLLKSAEYAFKPEQNRWINTQNTLNDFDIELRLIVSTVQTLVPNSLNLRTSKKTEMTYDLETGNVILVVEKKLNESSGRLQNHIQTVFSDFCGSVTASLRESKLLTDFNLYPNPGANLNLNIVSDKNETIEVRIIDNSGKLVKSFNEKINTGSNTSEVDTADLSNGLYVIQIVAYDGVKSKNWLKYSN
jgi:Secretion system C-terminal sorting domain